MMFTVLIRDPILRGKNVLYVPEGSEVEGSVKDLATAREKLLTARTEREYPLLDTKIIVNWNGVNDRCPRLWLPCAW